MLCPFHSEKTPSFFVNNEKGLFYCQGCGAGGDIFKFVQLYNNVNFSGAISLIDNEFALGLTNTKPKFSQHLQTKNRAYKQVLEKRIEEKKQIEYNDIAQHYRICMKALHKGTLDPFSDLWCYYMNQKTYLDYLIEEGGY